VSHPATLWTDFQEVYKPRTVIRNHALGKTKTGDVLSLTPTVVNVPHSLDNGCPTCYIFSWATCIVVKIPVSVNPCKSILSPSVW